jgi:bifunctional pyridoxal-dependent enzyme with beta-cystathionase and maltose regulon repressor activities
MMITDFVPRDLPCVQLSPIEGTFLAWLDLETGVN